MFCNLKRIKINLDDCKKCNFKPVEISKCCRCKKERDVLYTKKGKICFLCIEKTDLKENGYWSELIFNNRKNIGKRGKRKK